MICKYLQQMGHALVFMAGKASTSHQTTRSTWLIRSKHEVGSQTSISQHKHVSEQARATSQEFCYQNHGKISTSTHSTLTWTASYSAQYNTILWCSMTSHKHFVSSLLYLDKHMFAGSVLHLWILLPEPNTLQVNGPGGFNARKILSDIAYMPAADRDMLHIMQCPIYVDLQSEISRKC